MIFNDGLFVFLSVLVLVVVYFFDVAKRFLGNGDVSFRMGSWIQRRRLWQRTEPEYVSECVLISNLPVMLAIVVICFRNLRRNLVSVSV